MPIENEMIASSADPADCFYKSETLRLHHADWGNDAEPPHPWRPRPLPDLGRGRSCIAAVLSCFPPDLRGHGDFNWAKGSSYSLSA
jgi:hypothetical protein